MNSTVGNGRPPLVVVPGDGRNQGFNKLKAGPAEVLLSAGTVPARGQQSNDLERFRSALENIATGRAQDPWHCALEALRKPEMKDLR